MSLPSTNASGQPSIRNFFRPKQPAYAAPPPSAKDKQPSPSVPAPPPPPPSTIPKAATATTDNVATTTTAAATATITSPRPEGLHPQATISRILPEHIPALRRITSLLLPVNYPDSFYARLSDPLSSGAFSRVILWRDEKKGSSAATTDKVIGGLVCRPEPSPFHAGTVDGDSSNAPPPHQATPATQPNALYIQSLVLLSPYRGLGLAAALLDEVVADAARSEFACECVWAHVWTQNEEGLRWYVARGFARVEEIKKYYFKLTPDSAWIVRREIGPGVLLGLGGPASGVGAGAGPAGRRELEAVEPGTSVTAAVANLPPMGGPLTAAAAATTVSPPNRPPLPGSARSTPGQSFQNARPETEWNDLPPDMQTSNNSNNKAGGGGGLSIPGSGASSRSSSTGRKKRDRAYPAAAFGN